MEIQEIDGFNQVWNFLKSVAKWQKGKGVEDASKGIIRHWLVITVSLRLKMFKLQTFIGVLCKIHFVGLWMNVIYEHSPGMGLTLASGCYVGNGDFSLAYLRLRLSGKEVTNFTLPSNY